ncbi:right-handed parallel beta-helix repeat-containing protein [Variovorax sp. 770b2]|uniref:right-handed parallel beta-helix repeat-containing protein n=1 Tax=Variovorax sp. 770b2 TaxID=1566271 RepID=UPI0015A72B04|nr:right-handed parallel beta-helix repeat-containing protein [Variovorax sp. 770b2]
MVLGLWSGANAATCDIGSLATLASCLQYQNSYDTFRFTADLVCGQNGASDCCTAGGGPLLEINSLQNKVFDGNGHRLTRLTQQKVCPAIRISNMASNIQLSRLVIDENGAVPPCSPNDACPPTIDVARSSDVRLDDVHVHDGKAYVVNVWGVNGFSFLNSSVSSAGIIGLYIGHALFENSSRIQVRNSVFAASRTNGLAIEGAGGTTPGDNVIANNVFNRNHYNGQWPDGRGGITTGGQMYLVRANNLSVVNNVFGDGRCFNCSSLEVSAVELGTANATDGVTLSNIQFSGNYIYNHPGVGFYLNQGSAIDTSLQVHGNVARGVGTFTNLSSSNTGSNVIGDASITLAHGGINDYEIQRLSGAFHYESSWPMPNTVKEATIALSLSPRPSARSAPVYRCVQSTVAQNDFISLDANCEGQVLHSILGYSFEQGFAASQRFYRCRVGSDHFVSWDPACEGQVVDGPLGYGVPR